MRVLILWGIWAVAVAAAVRLRNRAFAIFVGVLLAIVVGCTNSVLSWTSGPVQALPLVGAGLSLTYCLLLSRPRMRGTAYAALVAIPAQLYASGCTLLLPWVAVSAAGATPHGWWAAFILAGIGGYQTLRTRATRVSLGVETSDLGELAPHRMPPAEGDTLRVVQITDPHLGPFMPVARLKRICERAVAAEPDLVFITGDLLTMASQGHPELVAEALAPLSALQGRVFACYGNHDHEARTTVDTALRTIGAVLLVDEAVTIETRLGFIEIVGADFCYRGRKDQLEALFKRIGPPIRVRLLMLHDPGAFKHVPDGGAHLTFSGHTHGGQVGLVSLGIPWTFVRQFGGMPDFGYWARGRNRLYVHRGTGVYGFPVRLGVPAEESVMEISFASPSEAISPS